MKNVVKKNDRIVTPEIYSAIKNIRDNITSMRREVSDLRRAWLPAEPELIESLLASIHRVFRSDTFTAVWLLELAVDQDEDAVKIRDGLKACLPDAKLTVQRLAKFLSRAVGGYGQWRLECTVSHSREGALYLVTHSVTTDFTSHGKVGS